jgi:UDP-N-acetylglucosamine--N-acetylmuramyl-(pentapeptide) pyrophosphoryl-undecaprenol N-acetylglucosamine transferase
MQKQMLDRRVVITGGGSGGHVSVSTALINELAKRYENINENLLYIGGDLGMIGDTDPRSVEERRLSNKGFRFVKIRGGKLQRAFSFTTISLLFRSILGLVDAFKYLKEFKPDIVISTGGYVSLPVTISAFIQKIPVYIHEQTAAVGLTNKIAGMFAKRIFVTFKESLQYFPASKCTIVGNPIRDEIFDTEPKTELAIKVASLKSEKLPILYVSGGGLGSHILNISIRDSLPQLLEKYQVILQTGDNQTFKDYDVLVKDRLKLTPEKQRRFILTKFVGDNEIGTVFNTCDLFVGRSGANTVYELGVLKKPCILIPIPWVTHNEQEKNAKVLEAIGLATIVREGEISRESLLNALEKKFISLNNTKVITNDIFPTDSATRIIEEILG